MLCYWSSAAAAHVSTSILYKVLSHTLDAWNQVLERVQDVRAASRMKQLSYAGISGRTMFGLDHDAVVYLIEQLYGALHCHRNYKFRFHKYDLDQADEASVICFILCW